MNIKHTKDNCTAGNLFINSCECGLACGNCLACSCNKVDEKKLKYIAHLTDCNNHGGARWHVADLFPYLALYKRRFELIDKLHEIDGSLHFDLMTYRNDITRDMIRVIEQKEGLKVAKEINECLN